MFGTPSGRMDSSFLRSRLRAFFVGLSVGVAGLLIGLVLTLVVLLPLVLAGFYSAVVVIVTGLIMTQGVAFSGTALLYLRRRGLTLDYLAVRKPDLRDLGWMIGGTVLTFCSLFLGVLIVTLVRNRVASGVEPATNSAARLGMQHPEVLLVLIPASFLLIGPGEELLFRGIVQNRIREAFGPTAGVLLAAAIFAGIHFPAFAGSPAARLMSIAILLFPSLVFGAVYELNESLVVTSFMHGAYDAFLFGTLYLSVAGS